MARLHEELGTPGEFAAEVLAEAEESAAAPTLPPLDRTDLPLVTIDPESARDLDQALHLERRGSGYRVHYAIADVASSVHPGGAVDQEAHRRGETLYGPGSKVPLHPPRISEEACSLLPDGPRAALLWSIDLDEAGEQTAVRLERAVVRSRAKLSYDGVQAALDAGTADPALELLREVGELRLARERDRGGVNLPLPDQEVTRVDGRWELGYREPLPVEGWNAQISLLTGMAAAALMLDGGVGVLRTVPPADPRDVERLRRVAGALGVHWPVEEPYAELIRRLDATRADHAALLNEATSLLRGSGYVAFDGPLPEQPLHSAIAAPYSHVTAPLRRLVDRYALECCVALCEGRPVPEWVRERLPGLPATMQESGRRANAYERGVLDLVEAVLLRDQVGRRFRGSVVDVEEKKPDRGRVVVAAPAVEARVRSASGEPLPLGTEVEVVLVSADPDDRRVEFELP
ncbi:ribonuclease catalytic domain-containing protein [Nocardioides caldifontis]|uniref:ribonuclease catalytic domain-containing protein n=1 Tax=Nocardioides caldifontis TaxID=2588938 RepID=UPI001EEFF033|nr:RNB domain-containing ribonuclease [Nocardioides caldifontis]